MDALIEALTILRKYGNPPVPTQCSHDKLWVAIDPAGVSAEDKARLATLWFHPDEEDETGFYSYYFGSC